MSRKRTVEVFTAGCPLCDETVALVKKLACPSCDVKIYNLTAGGMDKAKQYGVTSVPTVVVEARSLTAANEASRTRRISRLRASAYLFNG